MNLSLLSYAEMEQAVFQILNSSAGIMAISAVDAYAQVIMPSERVLNMRRHKAASRQETGAENFAYLDSEEQTYRC